MADPLRPSNAKLKAVRQQLQVRAVELVERLGFHERPDSMGRIFPLNPMRGDRRPGSFVIWTRGEGAGAWKDYAAPDFHGDVFDLIRETAAAGRLARRLLVGARFPEHLDRRALRSILAGRRTMRRRAARDRAVAEAKAVSVDTDKSAGAVPERRWLAMAPAIAGTVAETLPHRGARDSACASWRCSRAALRFDPGPAARRPRDQARPTSWPAMQGRR